MSTETFEKLQEQEKEIPYEEYASLRCPETNQFTAVVPGESRAYAISGELICGNIGFTFTPTPDGGYEFRVGIEAEQFLKTIIHHAVFS